MPIAKFVSRVFITAGLFAALILLVVVVLGVPDSVHAPISAAPLALGGIAYAILQIAVRPDPITLAKRVVLAATFVAWGVDQMLPAGRAATILGDCVIAAYVLDLSWMIAEQIGALNGSETEPQATPPPHPPADARA